MKKALPISIIVVLVLIIGGTIIGINWDKIVPTKTYVPSFEELPEVETYKVQTRNTHYTDCSVKEDHTVSEDIFQLSRTSSFVKLKLWGRMTSGEEFCEQHAVGRGIVQVSSTDFYASVYCIDEGNDYFVGQIHFDNSWAEYKDAPPEQSTAIPSTLRYKEAVFEFPEGGCKVIKLKGDINRHYEHGNKLYAHAITLPYTYSTLLDEEDITGIPQKVLCPTEYEYCSYITTGCDKFLDKTIQESYECDDKGCYGVYFNYEKTYECDIPTTKGVPAKLLTYGRSYTQLCDTTLPNYCLKGTKRCGSTNNVEVCVDNNGDNCGDGWKTEEVCGTGQKCENNVCICEANECTLGQRICQDNGYIECKKDANGCTYFSGVIPCPTGQVCSGGVCGCPEASCNVGAKKCYGSTQYKECGVYSGTCPSWGSPQNCPSQQICENGNCVCPDIGNDVGDRKCYGTKYQIYDIYGSDNCPSWGTPISCPSGQECNSGVCGCPASNYNLGDTRCTSGTTYQSFDIQGNNICPTWSSEINCPENQICSNGECKCPTTTYSLGDVKCYNSNSYQIWSVYSGTCPSWGSSINCPSGQECKNSVCACPTNQCTIGETRCNGNTVQECQVVNSCTGWVDLITCGSDEICLKQSPAQCYKFFESVEIITEPEYSYESPISITVRVETEIISLSGVKIYPQLIGDGKIIQSFPEPLILYGNEASFSFNPLTQTYSKVEVKIRLVKDSAEQIANKEIFLKNVMSLSLSNVPPNYIQQEVVVGVSVQPSGVDYTLENIILKNPDGGIISPSSISTSSIKFIPYSEGLYNLQATAKSNGYTQSTDEISISVTPKSITFEFYLDNNDINTIVGSEIDAGTHTFVIKAFDSAGNPYDIDNIDLYVYPPEGESFKKKIDFVRLSTGVEKSTVNFPDAGKLYKIDGYIQIFGTDTIEEINYKYPKSFKTVGEETILPEINFTYIIIGVVALIFIVALVILALRSKKS